MLDQTIFFSSSGKLRSSSSNWFTWAILMSWILSSDASGLSYSLISCRLSFIWLIQYHNVKLLRPEIERSMDRDSSEMTSLLTASENKTRNLKIESKFLRLHRIQVNLDCSIYTRTRWWVTTNWLMLSFIHLIHSFICRHWNMETYMGVKHRLARIKYLWSVITFAVLIGTC